MKLKHNPIKYDVWIAKDKSVWCHIYVSVDTLVRELISHETSFKVPSIFEVLDKR